MPSAVTYREQLYINARLAGKSRIQAAKLAGFTPGVAQHAGTMVEIGSVRERIEKLQAELVDQATQLGLAEARELHETLTDALRGKVSDLYRDGELLPIDEWPLWAQQGGVEVVDMPNMVPSRDGDSASWDQVGRKQIVKTLPRHKIMEMLGKLKAVDAFVAQQKTGDVHIHLEQEKVREKLASARKRHAKIIEAQAIPQDVGTHKMLGSGEVYEVKAEPESAPQQGSTPQDVVDDVTLT